MLASIELECFDDLRQELEEGEGEVYDETQLLHDLKALGPEGVNEETGETELLDNDNGRKQTGPGCLDNL